MNKKILIFLLMLCLCLFASCGEEEDINDETKDKEQETILDYDIEHDFDDLLDITLFGEQLFTQEEEEYLVLVIDSTSWDLKVKTNYSFFEQIYKYYEFNQRNEGNPVCIKLYILDVAFEENNKIITLNESSYLNVNRFSNLKIKSSNLPTLLRVKNQSIVGGSFGNTKMILTNLNTSVDMVEEMMYSYYNGKLLLLNQEEKKMEIYNCPISIYTDDTRVYLYEKNQKKLKSMDDLIVGMDNLYIQTKEILVDGEYIEVIDEIIINGETNFTNIRVAIRESINDIADVSTLYHENVSVTLYSDFKIQTFDGELSSTFQVATDSYSQIEITQVGDELNYTISNWSGVQETFQTSKRVIIQLGSKEAALTSIVRNMGTPCYSGNLEFSLTNDGILVINDVNIESYLKKVIPSEMPTSWNTEALKSQAVAARTYTYADILRNQYVSLGYSVDDSTASQVYNNSSVADASDNAVNDTAGLVLTFDNKPIVAYYYSGSSGLTASGNEVWIETDEIGEEIPYLIGKNLTTDFSQNKIEVNTQSEESMLSFFKQINVLQPAYLSSNHRWMVSMTKEQLAETLKVNLPIMYKSYPDQILTLEDGSYVSKEIPEDIGEVKDIYVSKRGNSGVVMSIVIELSNVTIKIINQYNIRFTIRPKDCKTDVITYRSNGNNSSYTSQTTNASILTSGFFAIEKSDDTISFYGGGSGHGVGMDQYGANYYASNGKTYKEILKIYYGAATLETIEKEVIAIPKYKELFDKED